LAWLAALLLLGSAGGPATAETRDQRQFFPWLRQDLPEPVYPEILVSAGWLTDHLGDPDLFLLDARDRETYLGGHLPGATSLPPDSLAAAADRAALLGRLGLQAQSRIVCYGDRPTLVRTAWLFWLLEAAGGENVRVLDGGFEAWDQSGGPVATGAETRPLRQWGAPADSSRLATASYVHAHFGRDGCEILDARASGFGETAAAISAPGSVWRVGHVPHSLPVDFLALLEEDGTFLPPAEMRDYLSRVGPRPNTYVDLQAEFIVYDDGLSLAGARGYLLLRLAAIDPVRYYPQGWREWSSAPELPSVRIIPQEELRELLLAEGSLATDRTPRGFLLFDVRHRSEFPVGHLPGAVSLPSSQFADSLAAVLERHWPGLDRQRTFAVAYCYGPSCIRSRICATLLAQAGFRQAGWFRGGIREWRQEGEKVFGTGAK